MTEQEIKALARIASATDLEVLRRTIDNARGKSEVVEKAAIRRLAAVSAKHAPGTAEHDCWEMVHTVEELRRLGGRPVTRMNRMRPKIEKDGEIAALEYCALNRTDGFAEVLKYGLPELTAEAIVLRHGTPPFSEAAQAAARSRLEQAGIRIDHAGNIIF